MAQSDFNIANQLFPPTRADINNQLLALATNNSGTSAPGTTVGNMWWADTTTNRLKIRNPTNDGWVELFDLTTGEILVPVTVEAVPIGTIIPWLGTTVPNKWTRLDGDVLNRTDYPGLFNVWGTRFNTGGETFQQFRKPDARGVAMFGRDNMGGTAAGRLTVGVSGLDGLTIGARGGSQRLHQHAHTDPAPAVTGSGLHNHDTDFTGDMLTANSGDIYHYFSSSPSPGPGFSPVYFRGFEIEPADAVPEIGSGGNTGSAGEGSSQNIPPGMVCDWIAYTGALGAEGDQEGGDAEPTLGGFEVLQYALSDEDTALAATGHRLTARLPYDFLPTDARITLRGACTTGTLEVSATVAGVALFTTNPTIDATAKSSKNASVPPVLALDSLADDAEVIFTLDDVGDGTAYGLKAMIFGYRVIA